MSNKLEYERFLIDGYNMHHAKFTDSQNFERAKNECLEKLINIIERIRNVTFEQYQRTITK